MNGNQAGMKSSGKAEQKNRENRGGILKKEIRTIHKFKLAKKQEVLHLPLTL